MPHNGLEEGMIIPEFYWCIISSEVSTN
jgi:hypothetical protein